MNTNEGRYPRTTALDFMARCRPSTAAFYKYWDSKRRGRAMPARADIDPLEMKEWLAGTALIDVIRDPAAPGTYELRYRLVGSRPTLLRGMDVTGMRVDIAYYGANRDAAMENYRLVIEEKKLVYDWDHTPSADGFAREGETLLLPLSSDGETVDMVLVYQEVDTLR
ncbi:MAG TPA: PAS domain-containing protein [Candidatus Binatia bacterium]|nr:PAS domain-containing protein [Candidatus Binatia bacterium]